MNREIKFRGKVVKHDVMTNPDNGWVEGFYYQDLCGGQIRHFIKGGEMEWEVIPETVSQFTGLRDKNGVEIYEGDILVTKCCDEITGYIEVFWGDDQAGFLVEYYNEEKQMTGNVGFLSGCDTAFYNIYDNIHDNPNLLEGGASCQ